MNGGVLTLGSQSESWDSLLMGGSALSSGAGLGPKGMVENLGGFSWTRNQVWGPMESLRGSLERARSDPWTPGALRGWLPWQRQRRRGGTALVRSPYLTRSPHPTQEATWEGMQHNSLLEGRRSGVSEARGGGPMGGAGR